MFCTKFVCVFLIFVVCATCRAHLIFLDLFIIKNLMRTTNIDARHYALVSSLLLLLLSATDLFRHMSILVFYLSSGKK